MGRIQWNDLKDATPKELKKVYKLDDRQLERQILRHLDGASNTERRETYEMVYGKRK